MKKLFLGLLLGVGAVGLFSMDSDAANIEMHRLYNPNSGEHFYTADTNERNQLVNVGWKSEGTGWIAPDAGEPVYRVYNLNSGDHHYTLSAGERDQLVSVGWKNEGRGWYSDTNRSVPLYRAYNPNAKSGTHNYTTNVPEQLNLLLAGWRDEGVGWYGVGNGTSTPEPEQPASNGLLDQKYAQQTLVLLNEYRASKGLNPLTLDAEFTKASEIRSKELVQSYSHTRPNGEKFGTAYNGPYRSRSEVAGQDFDGYEFKIAQISLDGFKESPSHDALLTRDDIQFIGISFYKTNGKIYYAWMTGMRL